MEIVQGLEHSIETYGAINVYNDGDMHRWPGCRPLRRVQHSSPVIGTSTAVQTGSNAFKAIRRQTPVSLQRSLAAR